MNPQSCKAKGRRLQQWMRDRLLQIGASIGLQPGDVESRAMGQNGCDVYFSPRAGWNLPFAIECKNQQSLNVFSTFAKHAEKYKNAVAHDPTNYALVKPLIPLLVHSKNRNQPMVTMYVDDFLSIWNKLLTTNNQG